MSSLSYKIIVILVLLPMELSAQFYYFGRNKVQYTTFNWQVLRTEHFDIYYYPEMKEIAEFGAAYAESCYYALQIKFSHSIFHRIPLIFYSSHLHFQQTNTIPGFIPEGVGGFFEFMKGRVVIPSDGSLPRFRHVIRHELVHVFMQAKIIRTLTDHRIPAERSAPLWFTEGLAELWSTDWDDQAEMLLRDAVLNNYIVPVAGMDRIYGTYLMYKEGQHLLGFIQSKFGEEKILMLLENIWESSSFEDVMQSTIGKNYKELDEEWIYALKKKYYPLLGPNDDVSRKTTVLVEQGFNSSPVFYNNKGTPEIYFAGNVTGYTSIFKLLMNDPKKEPHVVITAEKSSEFEAFHLFQSKISISQKGLLAFSTKSGETDALHLYDVESSRLHATFQFEQLVFIASPRWDHQGRKIVFSSIDKAGMMDIYTFDTYDSTLQRVTHDIYDDRDPVWSPDGGSVIFSSDRLRTGTKENYNLFTADCGTGEIHPLTSGTENYYSPSVSPDGRFLTFTSTTDGTQNIWAMRLTDSINAASAFSMRKITNYSNAVFDVRWTDGGDILFSGFENYNFKIFRLNDAAARYDSSSVVKDFSSDQSGRTWELPALSAANSVHYYPYGGEYSLDIAQSQVSTDPVFGTGGGAAVALSDMLGNDQYFFLLYNNAQTSDEFLESFNVAITRLSLGQRTNYAAGVFHFSGRRYDLTDPDLYYFERSYGGYFVLSYPLTKFQRIESGVSISNSDKEIIFGFRPRKAIIVSNTFSFIHDNSLWGPTGPLDGSRFLATVGYTSDVENSNVGYYSAIADVRYYFRLGLRSAVAQRLMGAVNDGREARRFFMGGSWDLRGWPRWSLRGKKMWLSSTELRFPFVDQIGLRFPFGGIGLGSIRGAAFFDAGSVWDDSYSSSLGSTGFGVRFNFGGVLVLRYDVGKMITHNFSSFQDGLFYQFFFGWDF